MGVAGAIVGAGVLTAGAGLAGASMSSSAAKSAAETQAAAATAAGNNTMAQFYTMQGNLQPYTKAGTSALSALQAGTGTGEGGTGAGPLTAPFTPTMASLAATPGYQFTLDQGLQATQNSFSAQGLSKSGAALKGAANYAEGLAGTTYQQQFENYLSQNQQIYNMLGGIANTGEAAAAGVGTAGIGAAVNSGGFSTSGAAAQAAGTVGAANALNTGLGTVAGAGNNTALLLALNNAGMFSAGQGGPG